MKKQVHNIMNNIQKVEKNHSLMFKRDLENNIIKAILQGTTTHQK